jgi:hypothetical protein
MDAELTPEGASHERFCRYHVGDWRTEAQHAINRARTKAFWARRKAADGNVTPLSDK